MIWLLCLKDSCLNDSCLNDSWKKGSVKAIGYVPVLKRQYSEAEIRDMSKNKVGWSVLSRFVMMVQGIGFSQDCFMNSIHEDVKRLIDIDFTFLFEMELFYNEHPMEDEYFKQIKKVLENLLLYKVSGEISYMEIVEKSQFVKTYLEHLTDASTLDWFANGIEPLFYESAKNTTENFQKVIKKLAIPTDNMFKESNDFFIEEVNRKRKSLGFFVKND